MLFVTFSLYVCICQFIQFEFWFYSIVNIQHIFIKISCSNSPTYTYYINPPRSKWEGGCLTSDGDIYCASFAGRQILRIKTQQWHVLKEHIKLRLLVENGRASPRRPLLLGNKKNLYFCYEHLIQNTNDDLFRKVMEFLWVKAFVKGDTKDNVTANFSRVDIALISK